MKKIRSVLFLVALLFALRLSGQQERKLVILHTNDLHSRLTGFAPESSYSPLVTGNDNTMGGFSRLAALLKKDIMLNREGTLVIDGGDFLMGTLFHGLETSDGFQLPLMREMGYDIVCLGNHEFDFGPGKLTEIIRSSNASGQVPSILLGNAVFDDRKPEDDSLAELFSSGMIKRKHIIEKNGIKIGLFSLLGKDAAEVAPLAEPVKFSKQIPAAKKMVKELKAEKCDLIICVSHSGLSYSDKKGWGGEDVKLAKSVRGINIIISGHTHTRLDKPLIVNGVNIVQTGEYGKYAGRMELTLSGKEIRIDGYKLIPVNDDLQGDTDIFQLIEQQKAQVSEEILAPLGFSYTSPVAENDFLLECNEQGDFKSSNLGPLVADAIHYYVNQNTRQGTDLSMVAVGVIRDRIVPGIQTAPDIFRVMSLGSGEDQVPGYPLSRLYVTGKELKSILEILQVAYKSSPSNYCYYSGIKVVYDPGKGLLRKIKSIEIIKRDGTLRPVDFSKHNKALYSVTANSYMLEFIGIIKKMSFGLINVVPRDGSGNPVSGMKDFIIDFDERSPGVQEGKEWLALMEYFGSMKDTNGNAVPDIDRKYAQPVRSFIEATP
ncbi:MAG: bifunctional UDP-sugar hydrolase/5'-nucleotidase [Bacteroidales bacterium]|jgi:5'-nucleotidase|nr:bifunctional UDP-sugar hydrolase/5'-nucleotidase [Bacteroidales bacterium]